MVKTNARGHGKGHVNLSKIPLWVGSLIGKTAVSKTARCTFESCPSCQSERQNQPDGARFFSTIISWRQTASAKKEVESSDPAASGRSHFFRIQTEIKWTAFIREQKIQCRNGKLTTQLFIPIPCEMNTTIS